MTILLFLLFFLFPGKTLAADGLSLITSPLPLNLVATPGSTVSAQLKVKNGGSSEENLQVGLMKFSAYGDEGKPRLLDREKNDNYFDWVKFSEDSFKLAPNEWKTITMEISVPEDAAYGYYYAVTFGRKNEEKADGPRSTTIVGASASLVLLEVRVPNAIRDVEVMDFSLAKNVYEFLPVTFNVKVKNKGNIHVAPRGNIFISQGGKKDVAVLEVNEFSGNVLPETNRSFEVNWSDGFPYFDNKLKDDKSIELNSKGEPVKELKWDFSQLKKLRIGKYTATMLLVYDDGNRDVPIEGRVSFWVMPWRILGVGVTIFLLTIVGLIVVFRLMIIGMRRKK